MKPPRRFLESSRHDTDEALLDTITLQLDISGVYREPIEAGLVSEFTIHTTVLPEPTTLLLVATGLTVLAAASPR